MCYKARKVKIRESTMLWPAPLRVGGLYFMGGQLVRIESEVEI